MENEKKKMRIYSMTERAKIMSDIHEATEKGMNVPEACKIAGIHMTTYYAWKKQGNRKRFHKVKRHAKVIGGGQNDTPKRSSNLVLEIIRDTRLADVQKAKMIEAYYAA